MRVVRFQTLPLMQQLGFGSASDIDGGILAWADAGLPISGLVLLGYPDYYARFGFEPARDLVLGRTFAFQVDSLGLRLQAPGPEPEAVELNLAASLRNGRFEIPHLVLRGDLDWIIMRCLEKDRTRRYDTANGLALDIQRYL